MESSQDGLNTRMKTGEEKVREHEKTSMESIQFKEEGEKKEKNNNNKKQSASGTHGITRKVCRVISVF